MRFFGYRNVTWNKLISGQKWIRLDDGILNLPSNEANRSSQLDKLKKDAILSKTDEQI